MKRGKMQRWKIYRFKPRAGCCSLTLMLTTFTQVTIHVRRYLATYMSMPYFHPPTHYTLGRTRNLDSSAGFVEHPLFFLVLSRVQVRIIYVPR